MTKGNIWDVPGMIDRLRQLWAEGHSGSEIGRRMGINKNQVVGKVHRLGLPKRDLPAALDGVRNKPRVLSPARLGAAGVGGSRVAPAAHLNLVRVDASSSGPRAAAGSALVSLAGNSGAGASRPRPQLFQVRGCQFPMWRHGERPEFGEARYCDAPARRNAEGRQDSAYCAEHHARCFTLRSKADEAQAPKPQRGFWQNTAQRGQWRDHV
jgi:hypothetical protein